MRLVVVAAPPWVRVPGDLRDAVPAYADLVELRLDLLPPGFDVAAAVAASPRPCLATIRSRGEGGVFPGSPADAARRLLAALSAGVAWLDAEAAVVPLVSEAAARAGVPVLASQHGTGPVELPREGVAAWKVARPTTDGASLAAALDEARSLAAAHVRREVPPAFVVPYGPVGAAARVVTASAAEGAGADAFVFGLPGDAEASEEGPLAFVPALAHLVDEGRLGEVSGRARLFGLVGRPPSRSPSTRLHAAVFRAMGIDAVYLPECDLDAEAALALPYDGWSVTTPLKETVAKRCHVLDPLARRAGAVNTVVRLAGETLWGLNTDASVVFLLVRAALDVEPRAQGKKALVVGGGGFARAAAAACGEAGYSVRLAGGPRAAAVAAELDVAYAGATARAEEGDALVVNATPAGADGALPAAWADLLAAIPPLAFVLDAPYGPGGTDGAVARAARSTRDRVIGGGELLVAQAGEQALWFTAWPATGPLLAGALRAAGNLVLVGPRGAGKTVVGRLVARRLGKPFVDTDDDLARRAGRPAGLVLAERGEAAFRDLEADSVARACARRGAVLAVGGGALETKACARAVGEGNVVVRLLASPATAAARVRADAASPRPPLRAGEGPEAEAARVAASREAAYARAARRSVETDGRSVEEVAEEVVAIVCEGGAERGA